MLSNAKTTLVLNLLSTAIASATLAVAPLASSLPPSFPLWLATGTALLNIVLNGYKVYYETFHPVVPA